jgi:hypothetical protein
MAAPKKGMQAPIDRPLASSYLREFHGWSTAYPPGISDPSSLRVMENMLVTRDGALQIRPALQNVLNQVASLNTGNGDDLGIVGSFEQFFVAQSATYTGKAFLFAVRGSATISFRAGLQRKADNLYDIKPLTDVAVGFTGTIPTFSLATTFIKYLQIDNKVLALSDAGDPVVLFNVGTTKTAKSIPPSGLTVPAVTDALTVRHPDAAWIDGVSKVTIPAAETPTKDTLISSTPGLGVVTMTIASPGVVTLANHGLPVDTPIVFTTTGALPTGIVAGTTYYVKQVLTTSTFTIAATVGGTVIATTGTQSGVHSLAYGPNSSGTPAVTQNVFSFAFWFTFSNEFGESSPSPMTIVKAKRGWSSWKFNGPDALGNPLDPVVTDATLAADQLVAILPAGLALTARNQGATHWNLYLATWGDENPVPSEGVLVGTKDLPASGLDNNIVSWIQALPAVPAGSVTMALPDAATRDDFNYSKGPTARQGLVAGDRLILVNDAINPALIRWSSNSPDHYTDFSPSQGGGQKTLSSGNLLIPSCVKLWQNPQSVDTITILCEGVDGYHAAYYMAPASVSGQSETTIVMGFEETTATPGTTSPYGVEVLDNALYHPLETELMKSTASNYNLAHKTLTDDIVNKWHSLINKRSIISSQYDGRLYYIVDNPEGSWLDPVSGEALDSSKYKGNEIWVLDAKAEQPQWNRWLIPAISLRKLEVAGKLRLAVVTPETIYYLDEEVMDDQYFPPTNIIQTRPIPWKFETNIMGANRAHNAWAHIQDMILSIGNFYGDMEIGFKGRDVHGRWIDIHKIIHADGEPQNGSVWPRDFDDYLLAREDLKEWVFYGNSIEKDGELQSSFGQLNYAQFRYAPISVNVGYELGSIETFEYGRSVEEGSYQYSGGPNITVPYGEQ